MAKLTITIEDMPDGGVFIAGEPSIETLCERAKTPGELSSAEGYAMVAWIALKHEAERASEATGGQWEAWDGPRTMN